MFSPLCEVDSFPSRRWHRVIVGVQNPARLQRKVEARRSKNIDQVAGGGCKSLRGVDGGRRNYRYRGSRAPDLCIIAPDGLVHRPGPANIMHKVPLQSQGTLFKVIVMVRRHLVRVERFLRDREEVHHHIGGRSEEHTYELQSLMRISYAVFCLKKQKLQ